MVTLSNSLSHKTFCMTEFSTNVFLTGYKHKLAFESTSLACSLHLAVIWHSDHHHHHNLHIFYKPFHRPDEVEQDSKFKEEGGICFTWNNTWSGYRLPSNSESDTETWQNLFNQAWFFSQTYNRTEIKLWLFSSCRIPACIWSARMREKSTSAPFLTTSIFWALIPNT